MTKRPTALAALCLCSFLFACSTPVDLGNGSPDAGTTVVRLEECGNGIDDDQNGRIDDGCPCGPGEMQSCFSADYPSSGVGICGNGVQTCVAVGVEWGDWGDAACEGETVPVEELCNGEDDDCDGAVDEGCPCTEGQEVECGVEFIIAPCRGGTQTCAGGAWSSCEGAVEPSAEICDDGIDNDCDGMVDDGAFCGCVPEPELCDDGQDNDCDGVIDEPSCRPPAADGGVPDGATPDATLPPPEGCDGTNVPDFRDLIAWHTTIVDAHASTANVGGHAQLRLTGAGASQVAIALQATASRSYLFDGTSYDTDRLAYVSVADGSPAGVHAWAGPGRHFDTTEGKLAVGGQFSGTVDVGLGPWTSDPTLYSTTRGPVAMADMYLVSGATPSGTLSGGEHYTGSGVPADPDPGSYLPTLRINAVGADSAGNTYAVGTMSARLEIAGRSATSPPPLTSTSSGGFVMSLTPSGGLRWLESVQDTVGNGAREMVVDPTGRYLATIVSYFSSPVTEELQLRDAATGAVVYRHLASGPSGGVIGGLSVDGAGNVVIVGTTQGTGADYTLGDLRIPPSTVFAARFDRAGASRWSHQLLQDSWPAHQTVRYGVSTNGTEVAILVGNHVVNSTEPEADPRSMAIGSCERNLPWRLYPRSSTTGRAVLGATFDLSEGSYSVYDMFIAVLDAETGEHRWSRVADANSGQAAIALHPSGDVVLGLLNTESFGRPLQNFGDGPVQNAVHIFRLNRP